MKAPGYVYKPRWGDTYWTDWRVVDDFDSYVANATKFWDVERIYNST